VHVRSVLICKKATRSFETIVQICVNHR